MEFGNHSKGLPISLEHESSEAREEEVHPLGNALGGTLNQRSEAGLSQTDHGERKISLTPVDLN